MYQILVTIIVLLVFLTVIYKLMPYRDAGDRKPPFSLLPKYRVNIVANNPEENISDFIIIKLALFGFKVKSNTASKVSFSRGSVMGDFSVEISKVNLTFCPTSNKSGALTIEAGWICGFDTGDHWQLLHEIKNKIEA